MACANERSEVFLLAVYYHCFSADSEAWVSLLPKGTSSFMVQPILASSDISDGKVGNSQGFILLASSIDYSFGEKDRAWIKAISNKFNN